jgi:predicted ArsR family transcriptional regulator
LRKSASSTPLGEQICQHHCPVAHVAEEFPQLCEAETEVFAELLGSHVQRLATIAHGDGVCTTHLPRATQTTITAVSHHEGEST